MNIRFWLKATGEELTTETPLNFYGEDISIDDLLVDRQGSVWFTVCNSYDGLDQHDVSEYIEWDVDK